MMEKTQNWKTAAELSGVFLFGTEDKISRSLKQYKSGLENVIQQKIISGNRVDLCLNIDYLDVFCKISGERKKQSAIDEKTENWLSATELSAGYLIGTKDEIQLWLNELQVAMPCAIQVKADGKKQVLCLNKKCIDDFCAKSGYLKQTIITGIKTPEWKSVTDLTGHYIVGARQNIRPWVYRLKSEMPYAIQFRKSYNVASICLNINYLDEFCQKSGLINKMARIAKTKQK